MFARKLHSLRSRFAASIRPARRLAVWCAAAIALGSLALAPAASARSTKKSKVVSPKKVLRYSGVLQDEKRAPVGGIYQLEFSLYPSKSSTAALWSETHWVAVDNGHYIVELGGQVEIPEKANLDRAYIGVGVPGAGEILRERLLVEAGARSATSDDGETEAAPAKPNGGANPGVVDYAEKSGFSYEAELAGNSNKLEGMTVEDLKRTLVKPPKIGSPSQDTPAAGGQGGYAFEHTCPKGYVVTGMKGAAGLYVDSLQLICSPLE